LINSLAQIVEVVAILYSSLQGPTFQSFRSHRFHRTEVAQPMLSSVPTITALNVVGQLVGFLRMSLIAAGLGLSQTVDAYNL